MKDGSRFDDAYLGGERSGGKPGRGSENKIPFIAAVQTDGGHPIYAVYSQVKTFSGEEIERWANKKLKKESLVVSDGLNCFSSVTKAGCIHERNVVGKGRHSTNMQCFNWVNTAYWES